MAVDSAFTSHTNDATRMQILPGLLELDKRRGIEIVPHPTSAIHYQGVRRHRRRCEISVGLPYRPTVHRELVGLTNFKGARRMNVASLDSSLAELLDNGAERREGACLRFIAKWIQS